jgi:Flp pilus assembly pilin Flp
VWAFVKDETAQDLIEYSLILASLVLAAAALFVGSGGNISTIWDRTTHVLGNASNSPSTDQIKH